MTHYAQFEGNPAENYQRYFVPSIGEPAGKELVASAQLRPGERVLDAGCGTGVIARLAAERVGPGCVVALDANAAMLAVARTSTPPDAVATWHEASVIAMPIGDASFDVVLCQLVLQFVTDKPAALREMRRVLAPAGRLLLSTVGPIPPLFAVMRDALERQLGADVGRMMNTVFAISEPAVLSELARSAGFSQVSVDSRTMTLRLPAPAEFLWQYIRGTPLALPVGNLGEDARARIESEVVPAWQQFVRDGQLVCPVDFHVLVARGG